jgi:ribosomal protein S12 methylthiotransferase
MKTNPLKNSRINIITFGCAKNTYDSEVLSGKLAKYGVKVVHEAPFHKNDVLVVNTCGFINDAKQESIDHILEYAQLKKEGGIKELYVVGCLSERYKTELEKEIPEVSAFYGIDYTKDIFRQLNIEYKDNLVGERLLSTPSHYAYLKIADGCNHGCSFCAIPLIKGKHKSQSIEDLLIQTERLAEMGVKELILIAQDTTFYGQDIYKERKISTLINKLSEVNGIEWIRLQYAYPAGFPVDLLEVIRDNPKVCKYLDMPVQHISDNMLKIMKRGMGKAGTIALLNKIRKEVPGIAIRSTLIVGHPGETEKDFQELIDFVEQTRFERLGVFGYSLEENTSAYNIPGRVKDNVIRNRIETLMSLQSGISAELNQSRIGNLYKVIIDKKGGDYYLARTEFDTPEVDNEVLVKDGNNILRTGEFYKVKITESTAYDLFAESLPQK